MSGRASNLKRETQYHPEFNSDDADICFLSSDNIAFKIHNHNLQAHSTIFPTVNESPRSRKEIARMTERAEILYIVFKYIYPEPPHPKPRSSTFVIHGWSECPASVQVKALTTIPIGIEQNPAAVLKYLAYRNDRDMLDRVAIHKLSIPIGDAVQTFDSVLFRRWILSRQSWLGFTRALIPPSGVTFPTLKQQIKKWLAVPANVSQYPPPRFSDTISPVDWALENGERINNKIMYSVERVGN